MMRAVCLILIVPACAAFCQEGNLIRNSGFEMDENNDGLPDGWVLTWRSTHANDAQRGIEKQEPDWAWDREVKHSGEASVRCGVSRPVDDGVWNQENAPVPEGAKHLKVTAWIRAQNVKDGDGRVAVVFLGEKRKWLGANYGAITVIQDCDWTKYTGYVEVPKGAQTMRIRCWANFNYTGMGTFWFDDLELIPVDEIVKPKTIYLDETPLPKPTEEERQRGFMLFSRDYLRVLFPNAVPKEGERVNALAISACPGEYEPAVLAIRALRELQDVRVTVGDLKGPGGVIPVGAVDVRSVRFHPKEGQSRWGPFNETLMDVPLFLEKRDSLMIAADRNQPFWLTVHVPDDAGPGEYAGTVTVEVSGSPVASLPLTVRVYPFKLAEPEGVCFGMYTKMRTDPEWLAETFADMRAHGMTSIGLCGNSGLALSERDGTRRLPPDPLPRRKGENDTRRLPPDPLPRRKGENGTVTIDWNGESALERNMDEYTRAGFPEPMVWLMGADIPRSCEKIAPIEMEQFADLYRQVIMQINAHGEEAGWPEIIYQPIDEPFEHSKHMARATRLLEVLKSIPGVRTEEDGMNGRWENFTDEAYELTDVLVLHDGPTLHRGRLDMDEWWQFHEKAMTDGKTIWFYNIDLTAWHPEPMRFMGGFGLWKSKATGVIEWAYMFPVKEDKPEAVYSQPRALLFRFAKAPGESGGPTIGYEAFREGIDDYRYLLTLKQFVEKAHPPVGGASSPDLTRLADDIWAPIQAKLDAASFDGCKGRAGQGNWTGECEFLPDGNRAARGDHKIANNWEFEDYDGLRQQIAEGVVRLQEAMRR